MTIDKQQTSNRRFIIFGKDDYLCRPRNSASGRARSLSAPTFADAPAERPYQAVSTSSRTRSSRVWRFRISANLSPRTSASAGSGREL